MLDVVVHAGALAIGGDVRGEVRIRPGGSAATAAVWAAAEGARVPLIGRVGDDMPGRLLTSALQERGVRTDLKVDPMARTGSMLVVHDGTERSMVSDRGASACLSPSDLPDQLVADAVLVSGYLLYDPGSEAAARSALERARAIVIAVEASSWPHLEAFGRERFFDATRPATLLLANEREAEVLFDPDMLQDLRRLDGPYGQVCIKRGPRGATLVQNDEAIEASATLSTAPVDPTGAGDAFDGVLLASLASGTTPEAALDRACRAGAVVATSSESWPDLTEPPTP